MKTKILIIGLLICLQLGAQQNECRYVGFSPVSIAKLEEQRDRLLFCVDSTGWLSTSCAQCLLPMDVEFFRVCYNADSSKLLIVGRTGLLSVGIYVNNRSDRISIDTTLSESTSGSRIGNDGFFEIIVKLQPNSFLYFVFGYQVYVVRYRIGELYKRLKAGHN
jgi:hypothetical protein